MAASTRFAMVFFILLLPGWVSSVIMIQNKCEYTVWPTISSTVGNSPVSTTGFSLLPGESKPVPVEVKWSGRVWGKTLCSQDTDGKFSCVTGNCGSSSIECAGGKPTPPVTVAEFSLNGKDRIDFFDVSLAEGYNLPIRVGGKNCKATGCVVDLNGACPTELKVKSGGDTVGCKSHCESSEYCNTNNSFYSQFFKSACPRAYVNGFDGISSNFTCASGGDFDITFCPTATTIGATSKPANGKNPTAVNNNPPSGEGDSSTHNTINKTEWAIIGIVVSAVCSVLVACWKRSIAWKLGVQLELANRTRSPSVSVASDIIN